MNPLQLARQRLQNSRDRTAMRTADRYARSSELSGQYAGYNATTGKTLILTPNGAISTRAISNGLSQHGEIIGVSLPRGGAAQSAQMPS